MNIRWCIQFQLSDSDLEEMLIERGLPIDQTRSESECSYWRNAMRAQAYVEKMRAGYSEWDYMGRAIEMLFPPSFRPKYK